MNSDEKFSQIYASATERDDDFTGLLQYLKESPYLLEMLVRDWLESTLELYAVTASAFHAYNASKEDYEAEGCPEFALDLGHFVPNLFSKAARLAFSEYMLKKKQEMVHSSEQIQEIQNWVSEKHPEVLQDIRAEDASEQSHFRSVVGLEEKEKFLERLRRSVDGECE